MAATINPAIVRALRAMVPALVERHVEWLYRMAELELADNPTLDYRVAYRADNYGGRRYRYQIARQLVDPRSLETYRQDRPPIAIDPERVARMADEAAEEDAARFGGKLQAKLPGLADVRCECLRSEGRIVLTGTLGERLVEVSQTPVFKVSPKGKPFNQFPALIYLDGQRTTEAAYKALANEVAHETV